MSKSKRVAEREIYILSILLGVLTGLAAVGFERVLHWIIKYTYLLFNAARSQLNYFGEATEAYFGYPMVLMIFIPALGGLFIGVFIQKWAPEASGTGTDDLLDAFHQRNGVMRKRAPFAKTVATLLTIGTGGSTGQEGPIGHIGGGIGSLISKVFKLGPRAGRALLLAGCGGGLAAVFRSPLGAAITAVELPYKEDFETDALIPSLLTSTTSFTVFSLINGFKPFFNVEIHKYPSAFEFVLYASLAVLCTCFGFLFVKIFDVTRRLFDRIPVPAYLIPALGGLLVGIIGYFQPYVLGDGMDIVHNVLLFTHTTNWQMAVLFFAILALLKMVSAALTIQSGGSGGAFAPSLFIGAMLGGLAGTLAQAIFPNSVHEIAPFVLVGMTSFLAVVCNASIGIMVMVVEMTGSYEMLAPLMMVTALSLIFSKKWSLYKNQVKNKFYSKAHNWDLGAHVLSRFNLREHMGQYIDSKPIIASSAKLNQLLEMSRERRQSDFIVVDEYQRLVGMISLRDLSAEKLAQLDGDIIRIADIMQPSSAVVSIQESVFDALQRLSQSDFDKIPVINESEAVIGAIRYRDIFQFHHALGQQVSHVASHKVSSETQ